MPYFVFSTYEDTLVDWLFEAESLDAAHAKATEDTFEDLISNDEARLVSTNAVERRELKTDDGDDGSPADIEQVSPDSHSWMFRDLEAELIQKTRAKPLPDKWPVDCDLTRFDGFEFAPVRQYRDWSGKVDFYCEQCHSGEQPTFWTVYGHYDPNDDRNTLACLAGAEALIDCWSLADAQRLALMFERFRDMQMPTCEKPEAAA